MVTGMSAFHTLSHVLSFGAATTWVANHGLNSLLRRTLIFIVVCIVCIPPPFL
jgi:hypothetical protein